MVGDNTKEPPKQKSVMEMTDAEYATFKKEHI